MTAPSFAVVGGFAAGKTTLADELVRAHGYTRVSLAGRLKRVAADVYGAVEKNGTYGVTTLEGVTREVSGRQLLQELGQSVKALDRDFWIRWLLTDIDNGYYGPGPYVIDDCRFPYEAEALARDFLIVRVVTPDEVRAERYLAAYGRLPTEAELNHPSETSVAAITEDARVSGTMDPAINAAGLVAYADWSVLV